MNPEKKTHQDRMHGERPADKSPYYIAYIDRHILGPHVPNRLICAPTDILPRYYHFFSLAVEDIKPEDII